MFTSNAIQYRLHVMAAKALTTGQAAQRVGINRVTLHEWIRLGKVDPPKAIVRDGRAVRLWTAQDIASLREIKRKTYRKGRGPKKQSQQAGRGRPRSGGET